MQEIRQIDRQMQSISEQITASQSQLTKHLQKLHDSKKIINEKKMSKHNDKIVLLQSQISVYRRQLNELEESKLIEKECIENMSLNDNAKNIRGFSNRIKADRDYITNNATMNKRISDELIISLQNIERRLHKIEINDAAFIIDEFINAKNIIKGSNYNISIKTMIRDLNQWYKKKYCANCTCVFEELLIRYFVANEYDVIYPALSRYWRYDTVGATTISVLTYENEFNMAYYNNK